MSSPPADRTDQTSTMSNGSQEAPATVRASRSIARSAGIISVAVMISRVLGLVREMLFAFFFGASASFANDAFIVAFRIPNMLRDLFAEGALSNAFVTVFSDYLVTRGEKEALRLSNLVATALIVILGILVILGIIFAEPLVGLIAYGYRDDPAKFELTVRLTRIMMPFILLVALAAQAMGLLNSRDRFVVPALASSFFNVGSIIAGTLFAMLLADPGFSNPIRAVIENPTEGIVGMSYGVLIGGFLQLAVQWPSLRSVGFRFRPILSFADPGVRRVMGLMGPAIVGGAAAQVNFMVNTIFASTIPDNGAVSWLGYAFRLMQLPIGVFGVAIATATLPAISRNAALDEMDDFRSTIGRSIRLALVLTIPSSVGLAVLGRPIISLVYERGVFTANDTAHTANALAFYAIGLAGYSVVKILAPAFYAIGDARTPMRISLSMIFINFVMNWALVGILQERVLALSASTVALGNFILLYSILSRRLNGIENRKTMIAVFKILVASGLMALACIGSSQLLGSPSGKPVAIKVSIVLSQVGLGAAVFYVSAWILRVEELTAATSVITGRLRRIVKK